MRYLSSARSILMTGELSEDERKQSLNLNDVNSWNASNLLLQNQQFDVGWKLYDHGLRTPAKGPQSWQRALPKPFSYQELPLWKGSSLNDKSILLLEEQAIGDVMQFITLVPSLVQESKHLGLLVSNRLYPVYIRSFKDYISQGLISVYSFDHVSQNLLDPSSFDFQSPLGSICQYRFTHPKLYGCHSPIITADQNITKSLMNKYTRLHSGKSRRIIGISWRGGGTKERMNQKSISIQQLSEALSKHPDLLFISLQYGDCTNDIQEFKNNDVDIMLDSDINAVSGFDTWLSQVAVCDAVISVANTTIHASGGLNIPTLCLLSKFIDWRWLKDSKVDQSYWYPSVGIARQSDDGSWDPVIARVNHWIKSGCVPDWSTPYTISA